MTDNEGSVICDGIDLVFSVCARLERKHSAPKFRHLDFLVNKVVDVKDNCDALLVLWVADVVQLGDGEEGVGEVDVVQVEVLEDPPDQPVLDHLPNLDSKNLQEQILPRGLPNHCSFYPKFELRLPAGPPNRPHPPERHKDA